MNKTFLPSCALLASIVTTAGLSGVGACGGQIDAQTRADGGASSGGGPSASSSASASASAPATPTATATSTATPTPTPTASATSNPTPVPTACTGATTPTSPPSVSDGKCTLEGTWDEVSPPDGSDPPTQASVMFDAEGNWFGGTYQADVCSTEFMHGTYTLGTGTFGIVTGYGMGPECNPQSPATYSIAFNADCTTATIKGLTDDCTGGRLYLMDGSVLTKR